MSIHKWRHPSEGGEYFCDAWYKGVYVTEVGVRINENLHDVINEWSLQRCYFQTDVCGIKWIVFRENDQPAGLEASDDPVLQSYARCLESELLSVWRRVPRRALLSQCSSYDMPPSTTTSKPSNSDDKNLLTQRKELWIFWYGDKPEELLKKLVDSQLKEVPDISGTWENVLPYEARTLLYKALNNLIERHVTLFFSSAQCFCVKKCFSSRANLKKQKNITAEENVFSSALIKSSKAILL